MTKTLKELGFKRQPKEKSKRDLLDINKRPFKGVNSVSLEELSNEFHSRRNHLSSDAPPETGIGGSGHDDIVDKDDAGFKSYMGGKWKEGYPR